MYVCMYILYIFLSLAIMYWLRYCSGENSLVLVVEATVVQVVNTGMYGLI